MEKVNGGWIAGTVGVLLIVAASIVLDSADVVQTKLDIDYCIQVETFYATNGEYGWPDYRKNYATSCVILHK